jgi:hypothetical protein
MACEEVDVYLQYPQPRLSMEMKNRLHAPASLPYVIHLIGGWMVPSFGLNDVEKRKVF